MINRLLGRYMSPSSSAPASATSSSSSSSMGNVQMGAPAAPRAGLLDAKGSSSVGDDRRVAFTSARFCKTSQQSLALVKVRALCTPPGHTLDKAQAERLRGLALQVMDYPDDDKIQDLIDAAGGPGIRREALEALVQAANTSRNGEPIHTLATKLVECMGARDMPQARRDDIIGALGRLAGRPLDLSVHAFVRALATTALAAAPGQEAQRPELPPDAQPHIQALFDRVMLQPTYHHIDLYHRWSSLLSSLDHLNIPWLHASFDHLMGAVLEASIQFGRLPPADDRFGMPSLVPLPHQPNARLLNSSARTILGHPSRLVVDYFATRLNAAAAGVRPDALWQLYTDLACTMQSMGPAGQRRLTRLVDAAVGMAGELTLVQCHEMVHALAAAFPEPAAFLQAVRALPTPLPAPHLAALMAALTDALLEHTPPEARTQALNALLDEFVAIAPGLSPDQNTCAVMGLFSAFARRHGGREPKTLAPLKSALDERRRGAEATEGSEAAMRHMAAHFHKGLLLALEPERALAPAPEAAGQSLLQAPDLLLVAFGMPLHAAPGVVAGGLEELAQRNIPPDVATDVITESTRGRQLLTDKPALRALHLELLARVLQPRLGADAKHVAGGSRSAAGEPSPGAQFEAITELLAFYEGLELAFGFHSPKNRPSYESLSDRLTSDARSVMAQCGADVQKVLAPVRPDLAKSLDSRLASTAYRLALNRGEFVELAADLTPKAALRRVDAHGAILRHRAGLPPTGNYPYSEPKTAAPQQADAKSAPTGADPGEPTPASLGKLMQALPATPQKAQQSLAPFAELFAGAHHPAVRRELTAQIVAAAPGTSPYALDMVAHELAVHLGAGSVRWKVLDALASDLLTPDTITATAAQAITLGLARGVGGAGLPDALLVVLLAPALARGPQALPPDKQEAIVRALTRAVGQAGRIALIQLIDTSSLAPADRERLQATVVSATHSFSSSNATPPRLVQATTPNLSPNAPG